MSFTSPPVYTFFLVSAASSDRGQAVFGPFVLPSGFKAHPVRIAEENACEAAVFAEPFIFDVGAVFAQACLQFLQRFQGGKAECEVVQAPFAVRAAWMSDAERGFAFGFLTGEPISMCARMRRIFGRSSSLWSKGNLATPCR
jgi:hypothetical protein